MLVLQAIRIHVTILTRGLTGHLLMPSLQNLPGKIWDDNTRKRVKCSLESFPRDRPRVSLLINDNYSVNFWFPSRLTGNKEQRPRKTLSPSTQTMNTQLNVRSLVAKDVVSAPGLSQRKDLSPGLTECYHKICEKRFLYHSIVLCKSCNKCHECCLKSACRGQTSKLLANLAGSGCWSESCSNPKRGVLPPLSDPAKVSKMSHCHNRYVNPHRNSYLLEAMHQLIDKNAVELVQNKKSLGFFNRLFLVPKPNNK